MRYITAIPNTGAGIGHAFIDWAKAFYLSQRHNVSFLYSPFSKNNARWESVLGLGATCESFHHKPIDLVYKSNEITFEEYLNFEHSGRDSVYIIDGNSQDCLVKGPDSYEMLSRFIRLSYLRARRKRPFLNPYKPNRIRVAVHIRRGNITEDKRFSSRALSIDYYAETLSILNDIYSRDEIDVVILSNGNLDELQVLRESFNIRFLQYNSDVQDLHTLVMSDVLISSRSGFSYLASLINIKSVKIVPDNFWHSWPKDSVIMKDLKEAQSRIRISLARISKTNHVNSDGKYSIVSQSLQPDYVLNSRDFRDMKLDNSSMRSVLYIQRIDGAAADGEHNYYAVCARKYLGILIDTVDCRIYFNSRVPLPHKIIHDSLVFIDFSRVMIKSDKDISSLCSFLKRHFNESLMGRKILIPHKYQIKPRHVFESYFHSSVSCLSVSTKLIYSTDLILISICPLSSSQDK